MTTRANIRGYFEEENVSDDSENFPKDKETEYMQSSDSYSSKGKKKSGDKAAQQDHYALLGLGHLRYLATEEQIRKSYRETTLKHHPYKQAALLLGEETEAAKQVKKDEIENRFKAIQEAYEVLMDPTRRRIYDSTDEFDDEIPTDCSPQDFFKVFGPAFMRNGRWSVSQPIPSLGDDSTPLKEVDAFYYFWFGFKSWREFPHEDEFDLEQAESRDHKRWMERQNAKLSEKARKEEQARIRSLVDNAYKRDPRILRRKETLKAEKQKKKEAKFMAKKLQEEEAGRIAEENRRKKEEEDKLAAEAATNQRKIKEKEKKLLRKERTRLRTISTTVVSNSLLNVSLDDVENICMSFDMLQLRSLCDNLEGKKGDSESQAELLKHAISADKETEYMQSSDSYSSKGKKKSGDKAAQQDHYALLGLGHLRYLATEEQIRKSYRETALKHHPYKQAALLLGEETEAAKQVKKDEIENRFKAIQEAYEVLMDPTRQRIYDSTDEFDDEIPTDCSPQDFFKVFGLAFMRNGRWSVSQPIPSLGDDSTPLKEVDAFYDFWFGFKSWREFPHEDEFDLEQAESRDHKRWMEGQNAKLSVKARKEEHARIRSLVDNAYKRDPRILRRKEILKAKKQKKKEAKFMAKKLQEEEAARIAEENRQKKEEEDKLAATNLRKIKEKEKKLLRKERTRLRTISTTVVSNSLFNLSQDDVENICMSFDMLQLRSLCDNLEGKEGDSESQAELLKHAISADNMEKGVANNSQQNGSVKVNVNGSVSKSNFEKKEKPWGKEEIELLRKGIVKHPKGTSRRWKVISEYIGTGRSVEEILKATKTVLLQKPDSAKAFDSFLEKRKPTVTISSPLTTREEVVGVSSTSTSTPTPPDVTQLKPSQDVGKIEPVGSNSDQNVWFAVQETALVQAVKTFPKETNQRWERVAAAVPGKTVNQCKKQFALLKEKFRNNKK